MFAPTVLIFILMPGWFGVAQATALAISDNRRVTYATTETLDRIRICEAQVLKCTLLKRVVPGLYASDPVEWVTTTGLYTVDATAGSKSIIEVFDLRRSNTALSGPTLALIGAVLGFISSVIIKIFEYPVSIFKDRINQRIKLRKALLSLRDCLGGGREVDQDAIEAAISDGSDCLPEIGRALRGIFQDLKLEQIDNSKAVEQIEALLGDRRLWPFVRRPEGFGTGAHYRR